MYFKYLALGLLFVNLLNVSTARSDEPRRFAPQQVRILPEKTFIPAGFDDNDNVQLVLAGNLPNTCYKVGKSSAKVDHLNRRIYVEHFAYVYPGRFCLQVLVPYVETVNLDILSAGKYEVLVRDEVGKSQLQGTLSIDVAKSGEADDFVYAPVEQVYLKPDPSGGNPSLILEGTFRNTCMYMREVKTLYRTENVIEILPITDMKKASCESTAQPFSYKVELNSPWKGNILIYVRTLNGQAIPKVVELN